MLKGTQTLQLLAHEMGHVDDEVDAVSEANEHADDGGMVPVYEGDEEDDVMGRLEDAGEDIRADAQRRANEKEADYHGRYGTDGAPPPRNEPLRGF